MRDAQLEADEASRIVSARLGRPAQDAIEAAVVLEAWGGVPTVTALRLGAGIVPRDAQPALPGRRRAPADASDRESIVAEGIALLMAVLAIAAWAGPMSTQLGAATLETALAIALPVSLALQWALRSRYLSRRGGLRLVASDVVPLALLAVAIETLLIAIPRSGPIVTTLVAIWVGGTVLARRGWGVAYGGLLMLEAVGLHAELSARLTLGCVAIVTVLAVAIAVHSSSTPSLEPPGNVRRALTAAAVGGLLGGLLVGDMSLGWGVHGAFPALALVPSVVGSFWGGYHLWRLHDEIPRGLLGVPLTEASGPIARSPLAAVAIGALVRLVAITVLLSGLVLAAGIWTHGTDSPSVFVAFGCVALVCLLVSLLESLGCLRWALLSAAAGLAVELAANRWGGAAPPGAGLIAGSVVGSALATVPLVGLLRAPGRVLATALWIR
ncbi:MAG: hypothetical protein WBC33_10540 [Conexibacter sp.]